MIFIRNINYVLLSNQIEFFYENYETDIVYFFLFNIFFYERYETKVFIEIFL